jgi:hypothetical protein
VASADEVGIYCRVLASFDPGERLLLRARIEESSSYAQLAEQLGYSSADVARKAFYVAQAKLLTRLRAAGASG